MTSQPAFKIALPESLLIRSAILSEVIGFGVDSMIAPLKPRYITDGSFASFESLIDGDTVYVDKTQFACEIAKRPGSYLLTRPRRMGKTTLVSTLKYLFSKGTVGTEGLYCHEHWPDPYRYFVFRFSWHQFTVNSVDDFRRGLRDDMQDYAKYFGIELQSDVHLRNLLSSLITDSIKKLSDKDFIAEHPELCDGDRTFCPNKAVLLIDEYDSPLTKNLSNESVFRSLQAEYANLFAAIKDLPFRLVFITGVTSYDHASLFSWPNHFEDISLNPSFATCCGYTRHELERYFAPELERAQQVLNLSREELRTKLSYYYDGYLFSNTEDSANHSKRLFNTVAISQFLNEPQDRFASYWSNTASNPNLLFSLLKQASKAAAPQLLDELQTGIASILNSVSMDYLEAWLPVLALDSHARGKNQLKHYLLSVDTDKLHIRLDAEDVLSDGNAIPILFQSGYLSIKSIHANKALLGLANHEVAKSLASLLTDSALFLDSDQYGMSGMFSTLFDEADQLFHSTRNGGESLASYINEVLSKAPDEIFDHNSGDAMLSLIVYLALRYAAIAAGREVEYEPSHSGLVIYRPETCPLVEDVIIELKIARQGQSVLKKLEESSQQVAKNSYGITLANPNPYRYCIVFSNELREVGGISSIKNDGTYETTYLSPKLTADSTAD